jgi:hypothetical protein
LKSEAGMRKSEVRKRKLKVRMRKLELGMRKWEVRMQKWEVGSGMRNGEIGIQPPASPSCRLCEPEAIGAIGPTPRWECGKGTAQN